MLYPNYVIDLANLTFSISFIVTLNLLISLEEDGNPDVICSIKTKKQTNVPLLFHSEIYHIKQYGRYYGRCEM